MKNEIFEGDKFLAENVPGINVIVGGHTHRQVEYFESKNRTLILQTYGNGISVGYLKLFINKLNRKIRKYKNKFVNLYLKDVGEDEETKKLIKEWTAEVSKQVDVVIGEAKESLTREYDKESALGNWLTDLMRYYSRCEIAFQNSGGIRANIQKGEITIRDVYNVSPFDNTFSDNAIKWQADKRNPRA